MKNLFKAGALAASLVLVAAACAADEEEEDTTSTEESSETTETTEESSETTEGAEEEEEEEEEEEAFATVVEVAQSSDDFSILVDALTAVDDPDLVAALSGEGPFTVFAPTNDAFAAALPDLGLESADELLESDALADILQYHVLPAEINAEAAIAAAGSDVETLQGATVAVTLDGDNVKINDATVVTPDLEAGNGVVHVIDTVLVPPSE